MNKEASRRTTPSKRSLREIPEIDFSQYQVRRNRFALLVQTTGIQLDHDSPSAASLSDIPESTSPPPPHSSAASLLATPAHPTVRSAKVALPPRITGAGHRMRSCISGR